MSMPLVPTYDTKRCYATWVKQGGTAMRPGTYEAYVPVRVTNATDNVIIPLGLFDAGALNVTPGLPSLDIQIPCTDDPQNLPTGGWQVMVTIAFNDAPPEVYYLDVPVAGGDINLRTIVLPASIPAPQPLLITGVPGGLATLDVDGDVVNAAGAKVTGAVASVNGQTGAVTLTAASVGAAATAHTHTTANVTGLDTALAGKAATSHAHATSDVTGLDTALAGKAASSHTHTTAQVTGLDTALAGKASTAAASDTAAGLVELATTAEARTGTDTARAVTPAGMAGFAMKYVALSGVTLSGRFVVAPDGATYTGGADKITGDIVATLAP